MFCKFDTFVVDFWAIALICFVITCCDGSSQKVLTAVLMQSVRIWFFVCLRFFIAINLKLKRVVFIEFFSEVWNQNTLLCLPEKGNYSIVRIASVPYLQAGDCKTRLDETLSTWSLGFISLSFWYKLLYCLWMILGTWNRTSCAQVHELPQSHCGDNREGTLFSWLYIN